MIAHPSATPAGELKALDAGRIDRIDLVITSYGSLLRLPSLAEMQWHLVVLDEAQAIKNPGAQSRRAPLKQLRAAGAHCADRHAGGEPAVRPVVALRFHHPGLLGGAKVFADFAKRLAERSHNLRAAARPGAPYILRRLKTDKRVISDLPDKTELKAFCP